MVLRQRIATTSSVVLCGQGALVALAAGAGSAGRSVSLLLPLLAVNVAANTLSARGSSRVALEVARYVVSGLALVLAPSLLGLEAHPWQLAVPIVIALSLAAWGSPVVLAAAASIGVAAGAGALAGGASPLFAVATSVVVIAVGALAELLARSQREHDDDRRALGRLRVEAARRQQSQENLRAERVDLERHVVARTRELAAANEALQREVEERRIAEAEAIEASRTKSSFLANMSHELRTPLNAIIGYTDIILDGIDELDPEEVAEDLTTVRRSADNLLEIVNDILDLSKIEAGKMDVRVEAFPVGELLEELAKTVAPLAMRQRNAFKLTYSRLIGKIKTDRGKLRQILLNLLGNACKFTEGGRVELRVDLKMESGKPWFLFTVSDTGIGIERDKANRLFAPFTQGDESSTRKYGGTGLGLTLVRHFTEMLGGSVSVDSELGEGSSFKVKLPRELADPKVEGTLMISVH